MKSPDRLKNAEAKAMYLVGRLVAFEETRETGMKIMRLVDDLIAAKNKAEKVCKVLGKFDWTGHKAPPTSLFAAYEKWAKQHG